MQVKTFTGTTSQDVLAQIKAEMGPDAVILGNRTFRKNGVVLHEMTAGLERGQEQGGPSSPEDWEVWHRDWLQIKDQLMALMKPAMQMERLTPRQRVALEYLQREGVTDSVIMELYKHLLANPGDSVLECLYNLVPVRGWGNANWPQQLHCFTGPSGSGKTSTALRFALALRKAEPDARIVFVNADCLRGGGRLVLRHWAELSNFTYMEATDNASMNQALTAAAGARAIMIDVPGMNRDATLAQWFEDMGLASRSPCCHLTLSPNWDRLHVRACLQRYAADGDASLVWTKLDECVGYGGLVNVAAASKLPVSALSYGAELKESLAPATEAMIWRLVFKRQLPGETQTPQPKGA